MTLEREKTSRKLCYLNGRKNTFLILNNRTKKMTRKQANWSKRERKKLLCFRSSMLFNIQLHWLGDFESVDCKSGVTTAPPSSIVPGAEEKEWFEWSLEEDLTYLWISVVWNFDWKFHNKNNKSKLKKYRMIWWLIVQKPEWFSNEMKSELGDYLSMRKISNDILRINERIYCIHNELHRHYSDNFDIDHKSNFDQYNNYQ